MGLIPRLQDVYFTSIRANLQRAKLFEPRKSFAFRENTAAFKPQIFISFRANTSESKYNKFLLGDLAFLYQRKDRYYLYSRQVCLHFSQRKNCVGGSSAERVCCSHQYARPCSHFGHSLSVSGSNVMSCSMTTTPFDFCFSSTIFMLFISFFTSFPQPRHFI